MLKREGREYQPITSSVKRNYVVIIWRQSTFIHFYPIIISCECYKNQVTLQMKLRKFFILRGKKGRSRGGSRVDREISRKEIAMPNIELVVHSK